MLKFFQTCYSRDECVITFHFLRKSCSILLRRILLSLKRGGRTSSPFSFVVHSDKRPARGMEDSSGDSWRNEKDRRIFRKVFADYISA